jgi:HEAT repeat protein
LPCLLILSGCANFWDEVTSRDFTISSLITKPNPLVVLSKSTDGNKRAEALRSLREPLENRGNQKQQDFVVKLLTTAATTDRQPLCRLAAIQNLGHFKDRRAVEALTSAYLDPKPFTAETNNIICQRALTAMGETKSPAALRQLMLVAQEPPKSAESNAVEKQQALDLRLAAIRALANYKSYEVTETLFKVLQNEKDVALRGRAHESLVAVTGKHLPADARAWDDLLHKPPTGAGGRERGSDNGWALVGWWQKN